MASSSIFISAVDARQNPIRESVVHDEARAIETAILNAVKNGFYETTLSSGSPMTGYGTINLPVADIDLTTDQLLIPSHPFKNGDIVTISSTGTLPGPLSSTAYYYVIYIDQNNIKLAATPSAASSSIPVHVDFSVGVTSIEVLNTGSGYISTPNVVVSAPTSGTTAVAQATLTTWGKVDSIGVLSSGAGFVDVPTVVIASQGSGAVAGTVKFLTVGISVANSGAEYRIGDVLTILGGSGTSTTAIVTGINPAGSITGIQLSNPGLYTTLPSLSDVSTNVLPDGGYGATLNLVMGIADIEVDTGGIGYVAPPVVTITSTSGIGATAIANISAGTVVNFTVTSLGSGYTSAPTVTLTSGENASGMAVLQPTGVGNISVLNNGGGSYSTTPAVTISAQGSGAILDEVTMKVVSATMSNAGGGYTKGDVLLVAGGGGTLNSTIQVTNVGTLGEISSYTLITSGSYTSLPILNNNSVIGGSGRSATFNLTVGLESISLLNGGSGYVSPPTVVITPADGNGTGAVAYTTISIGVVNSIVVNAAGSGYTDIPNIEITSGTGATAEAVIEAGNVVAINIINYGSNYTSPPLVDISGSATASATLKPTGIARIEIVNHGNYYTSTPLIYVIPSPLNYIDTLSPSTVANIGYGVDHISVIDAGSGYNSAPTVTISAPSGAYGIQATATADIGVSTGTVVVSAYQNSRDYYKVWKNQNPSDSLYVRPYQERMDTVIAYFKNLGYTINRQTNPATGNTIQWVVMW